MNSLVRILACSAILLGVSQASSAAEIGDPAAPLAVSEWIKGEPVSLAPSEKVFVIEFWATWCPPCRESIPHLSTLQNKYKGKAVFVGVSDEDSATVQPFVEQMGDKMDYVVALDRDNATAAGYMGAYGLNGIPVAFVLDKQRRVTWIGFPMSDELDTAIQRILDGTLDGEIGRKEAELEKVREALFKEFAAYCDSGDVANANALSDKMFSEHSSSADLMTAIAYTYITTKNEDVQDRERALKFVKAGVEASKGKNPGILTVYARVLSESGDLDGAIREQRRALELAPARVHPQLQKQLDEYLAAQAAEKEPAA